MWLPRPQVWGALHIRVGGLHPIAVVLPSRSLRFVDCHHHRTEKWRLGARQVIGAIGVEDSAVVLNLKEQVLHHSTREFHSSIPQETAKNEVAVPAIHFVEAPAG